MSTITPKEGEKMDFIKNFIFGNREPAYTDKLPNQISLTCRVLVGGYLLYLSYQLKDSGINAANAKSQMLFICAIVIFSVFAALMIYDVARNYFIGRYAGGKLDLGERPDEHLDGKSHEDYDDVVTEDEAVEAIATEDEEHE